MEEILEKCKRGDSEGDVRVEKESGIVKVYLASPYSHRCKKVEEDRFEAACKAAGGLIREGFFVFSPIAHSHPIAIRCSLPKTYSFWKRYNQSWLAWADMLIVLQLEGWKTSLGVKEEIIYAKEHGLIITWRDSNIE